MNNGRTDAPLVVGSSRPVAVDKRTREAAGLFLHYIIDHNPRGYPGKFVLRAVTVGTMYSRVVVAADTLEAARERIPPGYANTGTPDGPTMLEVWV